MSGASDAAEATEESRRYLAIERALELNRAKLTGGGTADELISDAKKIEAYLKGGEPANG